MIKIKAVLFDQDGVILDSEDTHYKAERIIFDRNGIFFPEEEHKKFQGRNIRDIVEMAIKGQNVKKTAQELVDEKRALWKEIAKKELKIFPGFYELIASLNKKYKIALTTSAGRITRDFVESLFPEQKGIFDVEVTGDEVKNTKPHPEPYLLTASRLKLRPEECVVIEDSINGIISAKSAGMKVIAITNSLEKEELEKENPDKIVSSLKEINLDLIQSLEK
ncbi:MAG: HAD family phosphatase [Candidatus Pacearchaeota archaeon]|nr:HAD family phosphatase [Candidatus Pacearchaeota archaeon]